MRVFLGNGSSGSSVCVIVGFSLRLSAPGAKLWKARSDVRSVEKWKWHVSGSVVLQATMRDAVLLRLERNCRPVSSSLRHTAPVTCRRCARKAGSCGSGRRNRMSVLHRQGASLRRSDSAIAAQAVGHANLCAGRVVGRRYCHRHCGEQTGPRALTGNSQEALHHCPRQADGCALWAGGRSLCRRVVLT